MTAVLRQPYKVVGGPAKKAVFAHYQRLAAVEAARQQYMTSVGADLEDYLIRTGVFGEEVVALKFAGDLPTGWKYRKGRTNYAYPDMRTTAGQAANEALAKLAFDHRPLDKDLGYGSPKFFESAVYGVGLLKTDFGTFILVPVFPRHVGAEQGNEDSLNYKLVRGLRLAMPIELQRAVDKHNARRRTQEQGKD